MADLIDRQKIKARFEPWLKVKGYSEGELNMLKAVLYEITVMPSADVDLSGFSDRLWKTAYERGKAEAVRWIPCSERLPEKDGDYITTLTDKDGNYVDVTEWQNIIGGRWIAPLDECDYCEIGNVVAWMPLPEPYKDGEQNG